MLCAKWAPTKMSSARCEPSNDLFSFVFFSLCPIEKIPKCLLVSKEKEVNIKEHHFRSQPECKQCQAGKYSDQPEQLTCVAVAHDPIFVLLCIVLLFIIVPYHLLSFFIICYHVSSFIYYSLICRSLTVSHSPCINLFICLRPQCDRGEAEHRNGSIGCSPCDGGTFTDTLGANDVFDECENVFHECFSSFE